MISQVMSNSNSAVNLIANKPDNSNKQNNFKDILGNLKGENLQVHNSQKKVRPNKNNMDNKKTSEPNNLKTEKNEKNNPSINKESRVEVGKIEQKLKEKVTKLLGITEEELTQMLEGIDMSVIDLLIPQNMQMFLGKLFSSESSMLLIEADIVENIKLLKSEVNQILEDLDINIDQLDQLLLQENNVEVNEEVNEEDVKMIDDVDSEELIEVEVTDERTTTANKSAQTNSNNLDMSSNNFNDSNNQMISTTSVKTEFSIDGIQELVSQKVNGEEVIKQIVSSIKINLSDESSRMFIQLKPEHLGKVALAISSEQGIVTAQFFAENSSVKELIETNLAHLRTSLQQQGIEVDELEVVLGDSNFFDNEEQKEQTNDFNKKNRRAAKMIEDSSFNDEVQEVSEDANESLDQGTHSVDYSA